MCLRSSRLPACLRACAAALAACLPLWAGAQALNVSVTILSQSNCKFNNNSATLNFGPVDPSATGNVTASAIFSIRCAGSAGTAVWAINSDDGLYESGFGAPRMRHATTLTSYLPYTLNIPASGSVPKNVDYDFTLTGTIAPSAFQNAIAGSYSDTVTLVISP